MLLALASVQKGGLNDNEKWTPLHDASNKGCLETVRSLLKKGLDINAKTTYGYTPLFLAAMSSHKNVVELLMAHGADCNVYDRLKWTPLHYAAKKGWLDIVQSFVEKGLDINAEACTGCTPLLLASKFLHKDIVDLLIEHGATGKGSHYQEYTALHYASSHGWLEVVQYLLEKESDINAKTSTGDTPLHLACENQNIEVVEYLFKSGADCNAQKRDNTTPHSYLINYWSNVKLLTMCIESGAYVTHSDYLNLYTNPLLRKEILQVPRLCAQYLINQFNNRDLPKLYTLPMSENLPCIENLKIGNNKGIATEIEKAVEQEIQTKGHCNLLKACPLVLSLLSVKSYIDCYVRNMERKQELENQRKRSITFDTYQHFNIIKRYKRDY